METASSLCFLILHPPSHTHMYEFLTSLSHDLDPPQEGQMEKLSRPLTPHSFHSAHHCHISSFLFYIPDLKSTVCIFKKFQDQKPKGPPEDSGPCPPLITQKTCNLFLLSFLVCKMQIIVQSLKVMGRLGNQRRWKCVIHGKQQVSSCSQITRQISVQLCRILHLPSPLLMFLNHWKMPI